MLEIRRSAARSRSMCSSLRMNAGSSRRIAGSPAVPARMSSRQQRLLDVLGGLVHAQARAESPRPGSRSPGPTSQVSRCTPTRARTLASRSSCSMASMVASATAQAIGPPPKVVPRFSSLSDAVIGGVSSSARHGKAVAQRLGRGDHVRHHAVVVSRERLAGAADAALHLVEDQQRAGFVAALAQRRQKFLAHVERAADALHRLDDDGGGVLGDVVGDVRDVAALDPAHVERRARQEEPLLRRAPGRGGAGRPCGRGSFARPRRRACARDAS